jgi:hypothetical protein
MPTYWWFVVTVIVWVAVLGVWSFRPSASRGLWAIRQAVLVTLGCMVIVGLFALVLAATAQRAP